MMDVSQLVNGMLGIHLTMNNELIFCDTIY